MSLDVIFENLSSTYIFCLVTTFLAVAVAMYSSLYGNESWKNQRTSPPNGSGIQQYEEQEEDDEVEMDPVIDFMATQKIISKARANLTEEQLQEEKEVEAQQLAAIFELLKKQEAELNTSEIDKTDLEDQLGLYR
ncbi:hypothetical protein ACFFRR_011413 [Megaselia abdita]